MFEPRGFFDDNIFERKILEQKYSKVSDPETLSTAIVSRKMFDSEGKNLHVFTFLKGVLGNKQNCGLFGPDKKLSRATFGPRAVCCARLYEMNYE
jgi:hypothetical protein